FEDNPHLRDAPGYESIADALYQTNAKADGTFELVVFPGRGVIGAWQRDYLSGVGAEAIEGLLAGPEGFERRVALDPPAPPGADFTPVPEASGAFSPT